MNAIKPTPSDALSAPSVKVRAARNLHLACNQPIRCCYSNYTKQFQIIRMASADGKFLERTIPPQSCVFFQARPQECLEVHTGDAIAAILSDKIPCEQLACLEDIAS